ncbi:MAG: NAD(P)/FAD-dependent oxidoreductase [Xanthobacteraceae bacterium]
MTVSGAETRRIGAGRAVVIGAGPAGLMAAETLSGQGVNVTIYDRMPSAGRKFLMAGRGGLNLTHSEPFDDFIARYGAAAAVLQPAIARFSPQALRAWCEALGQPTFVGSSGRVFPRALKASPLLRAWLHRLAARGVRLVLRHRWIGWTAAGELAFEGPGGVVTERAPAVVLALGGGSWPRLGSDAAWVDVLRGRGVEVSGLRPANCGFRVRWSASFRDRFAGVPLKGLALSAGTQTTRGEAVVTGDGIEGGGIYALAAALRDEIERTGEAQLRLALRPDLAPAVLLSRLSAPRGKQSLATFLRKRLALAPVAIALMRECVQANGQDISRLSAAELASLVNGLSIRLDATAPLERAISTAGGIALGEIDENFMIRRLPGVFAAGEMLDWEAPTGGYLLQASFATGAAAGRGVLAWLDRQR